MPHLIDFIVPSGMVDSFKSKVLSFNFKSDEPLLTHHKHKVDDGFRYFTFEADYIEDISVVSKMLPVGSKVFVSV